MGERQVAAVSANVLDRTFAALSPNSKWIADFTYVWTAEGWLYVAAVIDLFSRRVVGWSMSAAMTAQLVTDALVMAIWRRGKPDALLHHSDRGSQYTSEQFQRLLADDHGVACSMSRSGNVWDNAAMESFFSSLKTERTARKTYRTKEDAKADVFDYIERCHNAKRISKVPKRFFHLDCQIAKHQMRNPAMRSGHRRASWASRGSVGPDTVDQLLYIIRAGHRYQSERRSADRDAKHAAAVRTSVCRPLAS